MSKQATGIEALVCQDIARRQQAGIVKYGSTVQDNPLPTKDWIQHAYEEALDLAVYLRRLMQDIESLPQAAPPKKSTAAQPTCFACGAPHHHLIGFPPQCPSCYNDNG